MAELFFSRIKFDVKMASLGCCLMRPFQDYCLKWPLLFGHYSTPYKCKYIIRPNGCSYCRELVGSSLRRGKFYKKGFFRLLFD